MKINFKIIIKLYNQKSKRNNNKKKKKIYKNKKKNKFLSKDLVQYKNKVKKFNKNYLQNK